MLFFAAWLLLLILARAHTELLHQLLPLCHLSAPGHSPCTQGWGGQSFIPAVTGEMGDRVTGIRRQHFSLGDILGERFALVFF